MPTKTVYIVGEDFDASGLTLLASYSDGSTKTISSGFNCTPARLNIVGQQTITVTYQDKTATLAVTVNPISNIVSGVCGAQGDNLTWTLNLDTGLLTIGGTGEMKDYFESISPYEDVEHQGAMISGSPNPDFSPFYNNAYIKAVILEQGVTSIGYRAFALCGNLTEITIPSSVLRIGQFAFVGCQKLNDAIFPSGLRFIERYAFEDCASVGSLPVGGT